MSSAFGNSTIPHFTASKKNYPRLLFDAAHISATLPAYRFSDDKPPLALLYIRCAALEQGLQTHHIPLRRNHLAFFRSSKRARAERATFSFT